MYSTPNDWNYVGVWIRCYIVLQTSQMGRELPEFVHCFDSIWIGRRKLSYKIYDDIVVIRNRFSKHGPTPEIVDVFI